MSLGNIHDRRELLNHVVEKIEIGQRIGRTIIIPEGSIKRLIGGVEVKEEAQRL